MTGIEVIRHFNEALFETEEAFAVGDRAVVRWVFAGMIAVDTSAALT